MIHDLGTERCRGRGDGHVSLTMGAQTPSASARIAVASALFFVTSKEASEALSRKGVGGGLKKMGEKTMICHEQG